MERAKHPIRRCAVYTRKSSEEGLEQDFNSLHAQREACEAFIASQQGEGWRLIRTAYDDGGISGATMERPALQRLLADVGHGLIDVVVVYKVDRLTRALADFAKIVEIFDGHGVSFVAVTQQFNTTTSMGRLTLNVLLSFAQFEREVTGERIRDKIAASKRKGMWMGGVPPLGYDIQDRNLVINRDEAAIVKLIYERYLELGSVRLLKGDLDRRGIVSKALAVADRSPLGRPQPLAGRLVQAAVQSDLYRRDSAQAGAPSGAAPGNPGAGVLGQGPGAAQRSQPPQRRISHQSSGEPAGQQGVRRAWRTAVRAGRIQSRASLSVLRIAGSGAGDGKGWTAGLANSGPRA